MNLTVSFFLVFVFQNALSMGNEEGCLSFFNFKDDSIYSQVRVNEFILELKLGGLGKNLNESITQSLQQQFGDFSLSDNCYVASSNSVRVILKEPYSFDHIKMICSPLPGVSNVRSIYSDQLLFTIVGTKKPEENECTII